LEENSKTCFKKLISNVEKIALLLLLLLFFFSNAISLFSSSYTKMLFFALLTLSTQGIRERRFDIVVSAHDGKTAERFFK